MVQDVQKLFKQTADSNFDIDNNEASDDCRTANASAISFSTIVKPIDNQRYVINNRIKANNTN